MFRVGLAVGTIAGAAIAYFLGPQIVRHSRPVAKAALKAALAAMHEAQVHGAEIAESAEDLYAEAKAEVAAEVLAAAMAAAQAKAASTNDAAKPTEGAARIAARPASKARAARKRTPTKRSRPIASAHG